MDTHTTTAQSHAERVRAAKIKAMAAGSYIFDSGRIMLLVPHGLGPAEAGQVARERLGHDGPLDIVAFRAAPAGVYITYEVPWRA
ncbi:MAG TPA: hypothetical protein VK063_12975 [Beutenbergiaceae bacterium]|nr:hypothetical protein [Beutenbergiaceae bacterium]